MTTYRINRFIAFSANTLVRSFSSELPDRLLMVQPDPAEMVFKKIKRSIKKSKYLPFILVGAIVVFILWIAIGNLPQKLKKNSGAAVAADYDSRVELGNPRASQEINKELSFPLKDSTGEEVSKLKFTLQKAELRNEIIVRGERATSVMGKTFLIVSIKIVNDYERSIQINVRDYLRLTVDNSSEKHAPEIHNDPVEVQAISTKYTRVAFPIDENYETLLLQVGEITGKKDIIKLDLK
jgi:hypothetical protein